jgi:hypothetical protein
MTQRQLSQVLRCTPRNVTGLLDALETAGLVARGRHPSDRPATLVHLTDEGTTLAAGGTSGIRPAPGGCSTASAPPRPAGSPAPLDHVLQRLRPIASVPAANRSHLRRS